MSNDSSVASDAQGRFLRAIAIGEITSSRVYGGRAFSSDRGTDDVPFSLNVRGHRQATADVCRRREWFIVGVAGDVILTPLGSEVLKSWTARMLTREPSPPPALTEREKRVLQVLGEAFSLGYRLVPDYRHRECEAEVDRLRRMGYVRSLKRQMEPTGLGEIVALPAAISGGS